MDIMYIISEVFETLVPIFGLIGTVSSIIGFWKIFTKWKLPGYYSLIPFLRSWLFSKDSKFIIKLLYSLSDGFIMILTPIFYYIRANNNLTPVVYFGITFYIDTAMVIVVIIWAFLEVIKFVTYALVTNKIVVENGQNKLWVIAWILFPKITKFIWGFSNKYIKEDNKN